MVVLFAERIIKNKGDFIMKKRSFKKMVTAVVLGLLFSTTVAYGATSYYYSEYLYQTQTGYSDLKAKSTSNSYAKIEQQATGTKFEYTVVNDSAVSKSETVTISGVNTKYAYYTKTVENGDYVKLKIYNNPANNAGQARTAYGYWTP